MCGRFTLSTSAEVVAEFFELAEVPRLEPRYNIAPTQPVAAVVFDVQAGARSLTHFQWGLIPSWSKDPSVGARMINARAETVATKPSYRSAFKRRRCLIPASGFYEWQNTAGGKQPHLIGMADGSAFALAGLWEHWSSDDGTEIESCTIITTEPNELLAQIHNRMPVILPRAVYAPWLDPASEDTKSLESLLVPYPAEAMSHYPVSTYVNSPAHDGPKCVEVAE